jgi:hypothetical protein
MLAHADALGARASEASFQQHGRAADGLPSREAPPMIDDPEWWLTATEDDDDPGAISAGDFVRWRSDRTHVGERGAAPRELDEPPIGAVFAEYVAWCEQRAVPAATAEAFAAIYDRLSGPSWY